MHKSLIIAGTEFTNFVRTKAFIVSIVLASMVACMRPTLECTTAPIIRSVTLA